MKILTMSFDDGTVQDKKLVNMLENAGIKATFNLNSGFFGQKHEIVHHGILCDHSELSFEEAKSVYRNQDVAVHTVNHPDLSKLSEDEIVFEVGEDHRRLEEIFGCEIIGMAYPGGGTPYNEFVMDVIEKNTSVKYARTTHSRYDFLPPENWMEWNPTCNIQDSSLMMLTDKFIALPYSDEIQLFYVWGHAFEFDKLNNWDWAEKFIKRIADAEGINIMTTDETYRFIEKHGKRGI